jgi:hypothetical protein
MIMRIGYFYALGDTNGNILNNFAADDVVINIGRGALGVTVICNFPLLVLPCRVSYRKLIALIMQPRQVDTNLNDNDDRATPSVSAESASSLIIPTHSMYSVLMQLWSCDTNQENNDNDNRCGW